MVRSQKLTVWYGDQLGRVPTLFTLTESGAAVVHEATGERPIRVCRSDPKPETFHHRLAIVKARLAIDDGFRSLGLNIPQWIMEQDRRSDAKPDEPPSQQRLLYHWFRTGDKTFSCQPDAACKMSIPRDAAAGNSKLIELIAYFEIDRSTERRTQFLGKYPGYTALIEQCGWLRYFPSTASAPVRILVVCQSSQRIQSLRECSLSHPLAHILRFTTAAELSSAHTLTSAIWQDTTGQRREFIRLPVTTSSALS